MGRVNLRKRLVDGVVWGFIARMIALLAALFTTMLLARMLSVAEMGAYFLVASIIKIMSVVGQFGLGRIGVRRVSETLALAGREAAARVGVDVIRLGLFGAVLVALITHQAVMPWLAHTLPAANGLHEVRTQVALWGIAVVGTALAAQVQRGFHNLRLSSMFGSAVGPALIVISYLVILQLGLVISFGMVTLVAAAVSVATCMLAFLFLYPRLRHASPMEAGSGRRMIEDAWPFWVASVGSLILAQSDMWIVAAFRTSEDVAHYGAALRLLILASLPTAIISSVLQSTISDLHARGNIEKLERVLRMSNVFATLPNMALLVVFLFMPGALLGVVYGDAYRDAALVLAILSVGDMVAAAFGMPALMLRMMDHERTVMNAVLVVGVLTIIGMLFAAEAYGVHGVATAIAVGTVLQRVFLWRQARRCLNVRTDIFTLRGRHFMDASVGLVGYLRRETTVREK
jgi:O-antigen/teichoic acid export membrane protein